MSNDNNQNKSSNWGIFGSAASVIKDASVNSTYFVASSTASVVSNGASSAASGISSWWNGKSEKQKEEKPQEKKKQDEHSGDSLRGTVAAMSENASKYVVKASPTGKAVFNIYEKANRGPNGNPNWFVQVNSPHSTVSTNHINVSKNVPGMTKAHVPISGTTAKTVGYLGKIAEKANDVASYVTTAAMIIEAYRVAREAKKDYDHGTTRNTIKRVTQTTGTYASGSAGAYTGGMIGSAIFPGIGTIFGGIGGAIVSACYGGYWTDKASEKILDHVQWDVSTEECKTCNKTYSWRKYEDTTGGCCKQCVKSKL